MRLNLLKLILISAVVFAVFSAVSPASATAGSFDAQWEPYYKDVVRDWDGGLQVGPNVYNWDNHRNRYWNSYPPHTSFMRSSNNAFTYSSAVCLVVCLTAKSGFSENVVLFWQNDSDSRIHYLYGNNGFPTEATIVYASSN